MRTTYDAIVIGTGQAGPSLAVRLAGAGQRVAIVERKRFGGTCVNNGCIPTKTLVASARAAWVARHAAEYGVRVGSVEVDMKQVKARKDAIVARSTDGVRTWLEGTSGVTVLTGHARFEGPRRVRVGDDVLDAERIFVNVGGRALVPPIPGLDRTPYLTNSSMMDVDFLPAHLIVLGGSYIGLEFAQMYARFGSRVTVIERMPRLVAREDDDVSDTLREILEGEGIEVRTGAEVVRVDREGDETVVHLAAGASVRGSHLLLAIGRVPNTEDLGLESAGIATERGFIQVDDELRTSAPNVWALGDCNGRGAFTHTSYNDYEIVADNLLAGSQRGVSDRITAYALFTDPPLGRCGMTEREIRASGRKALTCKIPMAKVGRAKERGETLGFMKIAVDAASEQILGAALLGIEGDEVVHTLLDVMYAEAPYIVIRRAMHIHPTVAEFLPTMLGDLTPLE